MGIEDTVGASRRIDPILVVTGHESERQCGALRKWPVSFAHNADFAAAEMLSSVQTGLRALPGAVDAVVLAFADQPAVKPETIRSFKRMV